MEGPRSSGRQAGTGLRASQCQQKPQAGKRSALTSWQPPTLVLTATLSPVSAFVHKLPARTLRGGSRGC